MDDKYQDEKIADDGTGLNENKQIEQQPEAECQSTEEAKCEAVEPQNRNSNSDINEEKTEEFQMPNPKDYGWKTDVPPQPPIYPAQNFQANGYPPYGYYGGTQTPPPNGSYNAYPPGYPPYGGYYPPPVQPREKRKMKAGTKAFFIIISSLFGVLLTAFVVLTAISVLNGKVNIQIPSTDDFGSKTQSKSSQDESSSQNPSENIVITPNTDGITLNPLPSASSDLTAKEIYNSIKKSIVGVVVEEGTVNESQGSGIIATNDGYLVSNAHVVLNSRNVNVKIYMNDETAYDAVVVGYDKTTDLAVLKIVNTSDTFTPANFGDSDSLSVGDWVLAIGNPGGKEFASSLTRGIVSAVNRKVGSNSSSGMSYIQTDAAINPGNSGGALVNMAGQVVGINSSKIVATGYEGMGFSIPITKAKKIIDDLMANGYVTGRTRLGITGSDITYSEMSIYNVPQGLRIQSINEESAFSGTQARIDDIITAIDGETITGINDVTSVLSKYSPGDTAEVELYRYVMNGEDQTLTVTVTLLEDKGETQN